MTTIVENFIKEHWGNCIRENHEDDGSLIGLPYPYVVPSETAFNELYYWDTYFTNRGLILSGRAELAKSNTDNILYLIERFGFMPNGNRTFYLRQSQPPFSSEMVRDIYNIYKDDNWLNSAYKILKKEYNFWMSYRLSDIGLNHYDAGNTPEYNIPFEEELSFNASETLKRRNRVDFEGKEHDAKRHYLTCCESGWDMNPRWQQTAYDYVSIELNSLLYLFEVNMEFFAKILNFDETNKWHEYSEQRKKLMNQYLLNADGIFVDYNLRTKQHSKLFTVASIYPMFVGLATKLQMKTFIKEFHKLEKEYGVVACEENDIEGNYQWNYPNGWACLQHILFSAFKRYGMDDVAFRVAQKYVLAVETIFDKKGCLLEKYNVVDIEKEPITESATGITPPMLGWSAGAYLEAVELIRSQTKL